MSKIESLMSLEGRTALVTGAGGAIGQVICEALAELGATLVLVDRDTSAHHALSDRLADKFGRAFYPHDCDLENEDQRQQLIKSVLDSRDSLSVLVNNAAFVGDSSLLGWAVKLESQTNDTWRRALEVNLTANFHLCRELAPLMATSPGANILNLGSIYGTLGPDWDMYDGTEMGNPAAYAASKGGLIQLTRWLATTLAPAVRANSLSPGGVYRGQPREFVEKYIKKTPLGRMATEDDFIGAVVFLTTDLGSYVTGQNILVDGGWSSW